LTERHRSTSVPNANTAMLSVNPSFIRNLLERVLLPGNFTKGNLKNNAFCTTFEKFPTEVFRCEWDFNLAAHYIFTLFFYKFSSYLYYVGYRLKAIGYHSLSKSTIVTKHWPSHSTFVVLDDRCTADRDYCRQYRHLVNPCKTIIACILYISNRRLNTCTMYPRLVVPFIHNRLWKNTSTSVWLYKCC